MTTSEDRRANSRRQSTTISRIAGTPTVTEIAQQYADLLADAGAAQSAALALLPDLLLAVARTSGPTIEPKLLTAEQAAAQLGISRTSVYKLISDGDLPGVVVGDGARRIVVQDLDDYIARLRLEGVPPTTEEAG